MIFHPKLKRVFVPLIAYCHLAYNIGQNQFDLVDPQHYKIHTQLLPQKSLLVKMDTVAQPAVSQSPLGSMSGCTANNPAAHHQQLEVPLELLLQAASKQGHKVPAGQLQQHKLLAGLSHVHLNGLQLTELHSLRMCPSLQVNLL
jgi:hypothetical protein